MKIKNKVHSSRISQLWANFALFMIVVINLMVIPNKSYAMNIDLKSYTTPGGLEFWYVYDKTLPLVDIRAEFLTGSILDPQEYAGATNFLTGMLDEGAGEFNSSEFQQKIRDSFAKISFSSGRDNVSVDIRTLKAKQEEVMDLVTLALNEPRFDEEPLELVRQQIISNIKDQQKDPNYIANQQWRKIAYGDHPYANPSSGTLDSVQNMSALALRKQMQRVFLKDRLKLTVVGDIDFEKLPKLIDKAFSTLPVSKENDRIIPKVKWKKDASVSVIEFPNPQSVIIAGMPSVGPKDPDFFPLFVANSILGGSGFNSRLVEEVREKRGLAYSVGSGISQRKYVNTMFLQAHTANNRASETIAVMKEELERMAQSGVTKKEWSEAISYLTGSYVLRFNSNAGIANQVAGIQEIELPIDYFANRNNLISQVTLDDIKRVANKWLNPDELKFVVVGMPEGLDDAPRLEYNKK